MRKKTTQKVGADLLVARGRRGKGRTIMCTVLTTYWRPHKLRPFSSQPRLGRAGLSWVAGNGPEGGGGAGEERNETGGAGKAVARAFPMAQQTTNLE